MYLKEVGALATQVMHFALRLPTYDQATKWLSDAIIPVVLTAAGIGGAHRISKRVAYNRYNHTGQMDPNSVVVGFTFYENGENEKIQQSIRNLSNVKLTDIFPDKGVGEVAIDKIKKVMEKKCTIDRSEITQHLSSVGAKDGLIEYVVRSLKNYWSGVLNKHEHMVGRLYASVAGESDRYEEITLHPVTFYEPTQKGFRQAKTVFLHPDQLKSEYYANKGPDEIILMDSVYNSLPRGFTGPSERDPHAMRVSTLKSIAENIENGNDKITPQLGIKITIPKQAQNTMPSISKGPL